MTRDTVGTQVPTGRQAQRALDARQARFAARERELAAARGASDAPEEAETAQEEGGADGSTGL